MYAVIETGGKQYRVEFGTEIEVEHLDVDAGQTIDLDRILLVADGDQASIGSPLVDGASVRADVVRQDRGEKLIVFKYKPKARRRVKKGHRQELTVLRISEISLGGRSAAEDAQKAKADERREREQREQEAARQAAADQALAARLAADAAAQAQADAEAAKPARKGRSRSTTGSSAKAKATEESSAEAPGATEPAVQPTETAPTLAEEAPAETAATETAPTETAATETAPTDAAESATDPADGKAALITDDAPETPDAARKDE
ncbi:MAG: 50S ribosomal protein L21 [Chloroflexota bacterium]|nr:50S ribosomal protein L21 [Chloroflexota bacterium]